MGLITLDISAQDNQPPNSSGWLSIPLLYNELYVFTLANFTTETTPAYADPEGDLLHSIKVTSLPVQGVLTKSAVPVNIGDVITSAELTSGVFKYQADATDMDGYSDSFMEFTVADVGSITYTTSPMIVTFVAATNINQAPSSVGDGELDIDLGEVVVFTRIMLTSQLNPPYEDPEGDIAGNLRIDSVPLFGEMKLNGVLVVNEQIIPFSQIDLGNLTYTNVSLPIDDGIAGFTFSISDVGSGEYRS